MIWTFRLPTPPSMNNLFVNVPRVGRVVSKKYKAWREDAKAMLLTQRRPAEPITYRVNLDISVPRIKNADISNRIKAAEDAIVRGGILKDDSLVESLTVRWFGEADCKVVISPEDAARLAG